MVMLLTTDRTGVSWDWKDKKKNGKGKEKSRRVGHHVSPVPVSLWACALGFKIIHSGEREPIIHWLYLGSIQPTMKWFRQASIRGDWTREGKGSCYLPTWSAWAAHRTHHTSSSLMSHGPSSGNSDFVFSVFSDVFYACSFVFSKSERLLKTK
jgi:hypothetical protein